jgi:hypothetical protein
MGNVQCNQFPEGDVENTHRKGSDFSDEFEDVSVRQESGASSFARQESAASSYPDEDTQGKTVEGFAWPSLMRNAMRSTSRAGGGAGGGLQMHSLDGEDPTEEDVASQIFSDLGLPSSCQVAKSTIAQGFYNLGLWNIWDKSGKALYLLKKVAASQEEGAKFQKLVAEFPDIVSDPLLAFPSHIYQCPNGDEILVMTKAPGCEMFSYIASKARAGASSELSQLFYQIGASLKAFHNRYRNKQHCDFQPCNIIYDHVSQKITFIDLANIGNPLQPPGSDVKQFQTNNQSIFSSYMDASMLSSTSAQFQSGYSSA